MAMFDWLRSVRFITVFVVVSFVVVSTMTTAEILWSSGDDAVEKLGTTLSQNLVAHARDSVKGTLRDVVQISATGAGLARDIVAKSPNGRLDSWEQLSKMQWFQHKVINSFDVVTNSGTFDFYRIWFLSFREPTGKQKAFFQNETFGLAHQYYIKPDDMTLYEENRTISVNVSIPQFWRSLNIYPTWDPPVGDEQMWGKILWGVALPAPLLRVFGTVVRNPTTQEAVGLDYKGIDLLQLGPVLQKVRPEGTHLNPNTSKAARFETRIVMFSENDMLVAATHGGVGKPSAPFASEPPSLECHMSEDAVVRASCGYRHAAQMVVHELTANGVDYLVIVSVVEDEFGLRFPIMMVMPKDFVYEEIEEGKRASVIAVVLLLVSCTIAAVVIAIILTQPLVALAGNMNQCAEFALDDISESSSCLYEIQVMQRTLRRLVVNLTELKAFLPQTLFADTDTDDDAVDARSSEAEAAKEKASADTRTTRHSTSASRSVHAGKSLNTRLGVDLWRRMCSAVVTKCNGLLHCKRTQDMQAMHINLVACAEQSAAKERGVLAITGDTVTASFNTTYPTKLYVSKAVRYAAAIASLTAKHEAFVFVSGLTRGEIAFGNAGTAQTRTYTLLGEALMDALVLSSSPGLGVALLCTTDFKDAQQRAENGACSFISLAAVFTCLSGKSTDVYGIRAEDSDGPGMEWMYQLQENEAKKEASDYQKAVDVLKQKGADGTPDAVDLLRPFLDAVQVDPVEKKAAQRLLNRLEDNGDAGDRSAFYSWTACS